MQTHYDAIIVGAGPAGSSAAILLARAGWSVALLEKQHFPLRKVSGECIAASNFALLESLGIGSAFNAAAGPELSQVALMSGGRQIVADLPVAVHDKYPWSRALGRDSLEAMLLAQAKLAGVRVFQAWAALGFQGTRGDWRCDARAVGAETILALRAPVAIDAHGSWDRTNWTQKSARVERKGSDLFAFKANFRKVKLERGLLPVFSFDGGYGGMVPADDGLTTVACCIRRDQLDACRLGAPELSAGTVMEAMLKEKCNGVRRALLLAVRERPWLATGPLTPGVRLRGDDAIFRIGNAAGEAHPIIGEGMSMALQSAWLLCAHLISGEKRQELSDANWLSEVGRLYAAQWRRHFAPRMRLAAALTHLAMRPGFAAVLVALAQNWPGFLTLGARWSGKARCVVDPTLISLMSQIAELDGGSIAAPTFALHTI
jgi:flavin-dependent dehydrogenase